MAQKTTRQAFVDSLEKTVKLTPEQIEAVETFNQDVHRGTSKKAREPFNV